MLKIFSFSMLLLIIIGAGGWYFLIKPEDYKVSFVTSAPPGTVYQKLRGWNFKDFVNARIVEQKLFEQVKYAGKLDDSPLALDWKILSKNDSLTQINIKVNHPENQFANRLKLLFSKPEFQQKTKEEILNFKKALEADSEIFKVNLIGSEKIPETTCACISLKSSVEEKAFEMMKNIDILSNYILANDLEMAARPRVHITSWQKEANLIKFDFCFPLLGNKDDFSETNNIFIKEIPSKPAYKAVYNGNYMFSHHAWFSIENFAENNNLELENEVLEVFNDNPEMGGNAKYWEAEIYIPVKK